MKIYMTDEIREMIKNGELPEVTHENYYSPEINKKYMSFHTWLSFHGAPGLVGCEARAIAELNGEYVDEDKDDTALMVGSYVDAALAGEDGELETFKKEHEEVFTKKGELKAQYKMAEKMIERCKKDRLFMAYLSGEKQTIFLAVLYGVPVKCKLDSHIAGKCIDDLKTTREMHKQFYVPDLGHLDFISYYNYVGQLAYYQEIVKLCTGEKLPCFINAVSKSIHPEIKIIHIDDLALYDALVEIKNSFENTNVIGVWRGEFEPLRCESPSCHYCIDTEVLTNVVNYKDLIGVV